MSAQNSTCNNEGAPTSEYSRHHTGIDWLIAIFRRVEWYRLARGVQRETRQNTSTISPNVFGVRHQNKRTFGEFSILGQQKYVNSDTC